MERVLEISGLRKSYGDLAAVDGLDLRLERGEIFGLLGHNGAGKTTTGECALGVTRRDGGTVRILAVADIYDALTASDRPYKKAVPRKRALAILADEVRRGRLDGELVSLMETLPFVQKS